MKYTFKNIGLILGLGAVMAFQSCTDLEPKLYSELDEASFESPEAFEGKLGDVYVNLQREYGYVYREGLWAMQENTTDECVIPTRYAGDWYDGGNLITLHNHAFNSKMREVAQHGQSGNNSWNFLYRGISKCNDLLQWMKRVYDKQPSHTPGEINEYKMNVAELRVLRAWYHYLAMDNYGNVPYVTTTLDQGQVEEQVNQYPRAVVFDNIMNELNTYVPQLRQKPIYCRVHLNVGYMVLAKMYLNAEAWGVIGKAKTVGTAEECYAKAAMYSDMVMNSGLYQLEDDYFANFKVDNEGSKENIWSVFYDANFSRGMQFHMMTLHYASKETYGLKNQPWNGYCTTHKILGLYERKPGVPATGSVPNEDYQDIRINCWERGLQEAPEVSVSVDQKTFENMPKYVRKPANYPKSVEEILSAPNQKIDCMFPPYFTDTVTTLTNDAAYKIYNIFEGARFVKFEIQRGVGDHMSNDFPIFRLADAYLMKAEAIVRAGGNVTVKNELEYPAGAAPATVDYTYTTADAQAAFDAIRQRAKVTTPLDVNNLDNICDERCRELMWEGHRRQDLIRFGRFTGANSVPNEADPHNLWILKEDVNKIPVGKTPDYKKIFPLPDFAVQNGLKQNPGYTE